MNRLLSRPVLALSRTSVRNSGHVMNDETIMHWKKVIFFSSFYDFQIFFIQISFFFCPVFLCIGYLNKDVRTPEHMIRPAWNQVSSIVWISMSHWLILGPMVQHDHRQAPMVWWLSRRFLLDSLQLHPNQGLRRWPQRRRWNRPRRSLIIQNPIYSASKLSFLTFSGVVTVVSNSNTPPLWEICINKTQFRTKKWSKEPLDCLYKKISQSHEIPFEHQSTSNMNQRTPHQNMVRWYP